MLLLEIIGMVLLYSIWKYETQTDKHLSMADLLIRLVIVGLVILGGFILFIDLLNYTLDKVF